MNSVRVGVCCDVVVCSIDLSQLEYLNSYPIHCFPDPASVVDFEEFLAAPAYSFLSRRRRHDFEVVVRAPEFEPEARGADEGLRLGNTKVRNRHTRVTSEPGNLMRNSRNGNTMMSS